MGTPTQPTPNPVQNILQELVDQIRLPEQQTGEEESGTPEEVLRARLDEFILPPGASDVTAFQDFSVDLLSAKSTYAVPIDTSLSACLPIVEQAFKNRFKTIQATAHVTGLDHAFLKGKLADAARLTPRKKAKLVRCLLRDGQKLVRDDGETVNTAWLRDIAEDIDGLVDLKGYHFDIFQPDTVNIGVRLVYRQEWTPLQYQVGELLHTIPLTPGEKARYETKTWYTSKTVEEHNSSTTYSSEDISSTTRRDVKEVMQQATTRFGVKTEASGSANLGPVSFGGSAGAYVDHEKLSRQSKQSFQEFMTKSAESLRTERRVAVSVTKERGAETRITREISNPNDEITVTYLFYELQRVYSVRQWLYDVIPLVYVAMDVPPAREITDEWVIRHDWLIAGGALDKSFIEPVTFTSKEMPGLADALESAQIVFDQAKLVVDGVDEQIRATEQAIPDSNGLVEFITRLRELKDLGRRLKSATDSLHKAEEKLRGALLAHRQGRRKVDRLLDHIRENILHYMQAIWNAEVPDQRYLRMRSLLYPDVRETDQGVPKIQGWIPLTEVADVDHPLGYVGNYGVFRLQRRDNALVIDLASHYVSDDWQPADPDVHSPDDRVIRIVTPADAVHVEALPGSHALLEGFKLRHRVMDMEKTRQETIAAQLENLRRLLLLNSGQFGDPKVEKLVVADSNLVDELAGALGKQEMTMLHVDAGPDQLVKGSDGGN